MRDRITEIIKTGTVYERKAVYEALIGELRIERTGTATPVFRVPIGPREVPAIVATNRRPVTGRRFAHVHLGWS